MQEKRNSIANTLKLRLSRINPLIFFSAQWGIPILETAPISLEKPFPQWIKGKPVKNQNVVYTVIPLI